MTNKQICAAFARGATKGKNSNASIFIEGDAIYSYGYHFMLAMRNAEKKIATVNSRKYSVTTSKQTSQVCGALLDAGFSITKEQL